MSEVLTRWTPAALRHASALIVKAAGSSAHEAQAVADNLVMANLKGHDSHGVGMLPRYIDAVAEGGLIPNNGVAVTLDIGSLLTLDGQRGYGQVVGGQAMALGIERALQHGSCIMAVGQSHHLGRIGHWAEMAVDAGLVSLHFANVLAQPVVAPWGGADGRFGTNPCCIGLPLTGRQPFILDFATSRVAQGKMRVAHNEGRQVPPGFLIDTHGHPSTDPGVVVVPQEPGPFGNLFGALMPFGEHKGFGLSVACELLGGALTGGGTWNGHNKAGKAFYNGMLTILIDPKRLGTSADFEREAEGFMTWLDAAPPAPGTDEVLTAGEPERRTQAMREVNGIAVDPQTMAELNRAAASVGASDWMSAGTGFNA
jgi:uncharacterized oxidoreductase